MVVGMGASRCRVSRGLRRFSSLGLGENGAPSSSLHAHTSGLSAAFLVSSLGSDIDEERSDFCGDRNVFEEEVAGRVFAP